MQRRLEIEIDAKRLIDELNTLATFSSVEPSVIGTAVTRIVFTPDDLRARTWLKQLAQAEGLSIREDAVGNTFFRWAGSEPGLPAVATGSHIDAIPHAGMYDGTVGVLGGLEAIRTLKRSGLRPRRSIELVLLTSEEPTRFGIGCVGSRLISGTLSPERADALARSAAPRMRRWPRSALRLALPDRSPVCACRMATIMRGSSCTSSRGRCSNAKAFPSASLPPLPRPPGIASPSRALAATLARS
jgi:N-carbamoyl-L-amino-acid hydrolase